MEVTAGLWGFAAHHKSTEPLRTTLQLLSSLMGSLGGESQGWWGLRYLAPLPRAVYHVGRSKYVAHAETAAAAFASLRTRRKNHREPVCGGLIYMCWQQDCQGSVLSVHGYSLYAPWPSWIRHRLQLNERVSDDGELWDAWAERETLNVNFLPWMTLLDMFWSFPALQPELMKEDWVRNPELGGGIKRLGWNKSHVSLCRPYKERWQRRACWEIQDIITEERVWSYRFALLSSSLLYFKPSCSVAAVLKQVSVWLMTQRSICLSHGVWAPL